MSEVVDADGLVSEEIGGKGSWKKKNERRERERERESERESESEREREREKAIESSNVMT